MGKSGINNLLIPAVLILALSGAITEAFSISKWLGPWILIIGAIPLTLYIPVELRIMDSQRIRYVLTTLLLLGVYRYLHSVDLSPDIVVLASSFFLLLFLSAALSKDSRLQIFSFLMLVLLAIVVFSPGLSKIFTLGRSFGSIRRVGSDVLKGISGHYINYSTRCMMAFFLGTGFCLISKHWIKKVFFGFIAVTAFVGCMTSGSRGGIIALLCGCIFFLFIVQKRICGYKVIWPKYIFLCCVIGLCLLPWKSIYQAFLMEGSMENRWYLYTHGMEMFREHLLTGIGYGGFRAAIAEPQHSDWLRTFVELGILGGIGEIVFWLMFFRIAFVARKISERIMDRNLTILITVWTSVMFSFCVWQAYENMGLLTGTRLYYICFGVISAAYLSAKIRANRMNAIPHPNYLPQTK